MSSGYFPVEFKSDLGQFYLFLFKPIGNTCDSDLSDTIKISIRKVLFPDVLIFVCIEKEKGDLLKALLLTSVQQELERCSTKISVGVSIIDETGLIQPPVFVIDNNHDVKSSLNKTNQNLIFTTGLKSLFHVKKVIEFAPPNFIFKKLSGANSSYFIKTEAALIEVDDVYFLAYSLLRKIAEREEETKNPFEVIFIDTMAISSLAYALRELYVYFSEGKINPRVTSFHSYDCISTVKPRKGSSLCLISASASMNMQKEWISLTKCYESEVVTLLASNEADNSSLALHTIEVATNSKNHKIEGNKEIRIYGERFTAEQAPIKKVILRVPAHKLKKLHKNAPTYSKDKLFTIIDSVRSVFVDGNKLLKTKNFDTYLEKQLLQYLPLSTKLIIYQDDDESKALAELCLTKIKAIIPNTNIADLPKIIGQDELNKTGALGIETNLKDHAVLIVAAIIGKGTKLLSISRDLRDIHTGAKNYLVGFQISDSIFDYEKLRKNLEYSSNKSKNIFSSMDSYAIGTSLAETYRNKKQIPFYDSSAKNKPLLLRNDFAMWNTSYDPSKNHSASVLLTISSILQNARESKEFEDNIDRLASDTLQQVVLDPENFARFNDGIIQAALLRAAHPQELDYSSDRETSSHMKEILKNIFLSYDRDQGEASYEMAHALMSGKLRICDEDFRKLMDTLRKSLKDREGKNVDYLKVILFPDSDITKQSERPI